MNPDKKKDFNEDEDNIIDWSEVLVKPKDIVLTSEGNKEEETQDKIIKYPIQIIKDNIKSEDEQQEIKIINGVQLNSIKRDSEGNPVKNIN